MKALSKIALATALVFSACSGGEDLLMLVGTYNGGGSEGIYAYRFNEKTGELSVTGDVRSEAPGAIGFASLYNASYLTIRGDRVYAVSEMPDSTAALAAFSLDKESARMELLSELPTGGEDPCYVATDGKVVVTANYSGGSMTMYRLDAEGLPESDPIYFRGTAGGPDTTRQNTPHVHCSVFTPDGNYILASDFSSDLIARIPAEGGRADFFPVHSDYGPRHITFSPDGRFAYVIGELSGDVTVFSYGDYGIAELQCIKADKVGARGAADIHISPDGKFLYASLRLQNDGIAIFSIGNDGLLTEAGYQNTGIHPRNFAITPNGKFLLAACRDSNSIEIYARDSKTGLLSDTGKRIELSKPVCIQFD